MNFLIFSHHHDYYKFFLLFTILFNHFEYTKKVINSIYSIQMSALTIFMNFEKNINKIA